MTMVNLNGFKDDFIGENKLYILNEIHENYRPKTKKVFKNNINKTLNEILEPFTFPFFIKPIFGERGFGVFKIKSDVHFKELWPSFQETFMVQECIDYPYEVGVFYVKMPNQAHGRVTSITYRGFLKTFGNGKDTHEQILKSNKRAALYQDLLKKEKADLLHAVSPKNQWTVLQPVGNHCKGTAFLDASYLINDPINDFFNELCRSMKGFHFGRFDVKIKNFDSLATGHGLKILELNGVFSEPTHYYDPSYSFFQAYREAIKYWLWAGEIALQNKKNGSRPYAPKLFFRSLWQHYKKTKG